MSFVSDYDVAMAWYQAVLGSASLRSWCEELFGSAPKVMLGYDMRNKPGKGELPYIAIVPVEERGGYEATHGELLVMISLGFEDEEVLVDGDSGTRQRGYDTAGEFASRVTSVLESSAYTPGTWEGSTGQSERHYFERIVFIKANAPNTLG